MHLYTKGTICIHKQVELKGIGSLRTTPFQKLFNTGTEFHLLGRNTNNYYLFAVHCHRSALYTNSCTEKVWVCSMNLITVLMNIPGRL